MTELFRIKPLEWEDGSNPILISNPLPDIEYRVGGIGYAAAWWNSVTKSTIPCASPEEGKQLAERHWRDYIAQALEPVETEQ